MNATLILNAILRQLTCIQPTLSMTRIALINSEQLTSVSMAIHSLLANQYNGVSAGQNCGCTALCYTVHCTAAPFITIVVPSMVANVPRAILTQLPRDNFDSPLKYCPVEL